MEDMQDVFMPGNLVQLRRPYKPGDRPEGVWANTPERRQEWKSWPGYTHGIIAEILERSIPRRIDGHAVPGATVRVSLHLYDPARALLYIHDGYTVPAYCDFHVSELKPHKVAADPGYATLLDMDGEMP